MKIKELQKYVQNLPQTRNSFNNSSRQVGLGFG